jgi:superfamily II DNA or RNA helicase
VPEIVGVERKSFKSDVIVRQLIGRLMRLHESKEFATVVDLVDDFSYIDSDGEKWDNYMLKHGRERRDIYTQQEFEFDIKHIKF